MVQELERAGAGASPDIGPPPLPFAPRAALAGWRVGAELAAPMIALYLRLRLKRGKEEGARLRERWGYAGTARPQRPLLWLHGASVGELVSLLPLIARLRVERPGVALLVTSGTVTSARLAADRLPPGVIHQFAPIDHPRAVRRFLAHWRPGAGIFVESEIWPTLIAAARAQGVELGLVSARLSQRSFARWRRFPALARALFGSFSVVQAQSRADAMRIAALVHRSIESGGNLKLAAPPLPAAPAALDSLAAVLGERPRWLAASTHPGEELLVAEAHRRLKAAHPGLLTLLVPRHPERGAAIAQALAGRREAGLPLSLVRRSSGLVPTPETDIYIADTLGELGLFYRLAPVVFMGGSLVPHGGQNLLEPARLGAALIAGPHTRNFAEIAAGLEASGALLRVRDSAELAEAVSQLLAAPEARQRMAEAGSRLARSEDGVLERALAALAPLLDRAEAAR